MSNITGGSPPVSTPLMINQGGGQHRGVPHTPLILTGGWRHPPGPPLKPPLSDDVILLWDDYLCKHMIITRPCIKYWFSDDIILLWNDYLCEHMIMVNHT